MQWTKSKNVHRAGIKRRLLRPRAPLFLMNIFVQCSKAIVTIFPNSDIYMNKFQNLHCNNVFYNLTLVIRQARLLIGREI